MLLEEREVVVAAAVVDGAEGQASHGLRDAVDQTTALVGEQRAGVTRTPVVQQAMLRHLLARPAVNQGDQRGEVGLVKTPPEGLRLDAVQEHGVETDLAAVGGTAGAGADGPVRGVGPVDEPGLHAGERSQCTIQSGCHGVPVSIIRMNIAE